MSQTLEWTPKQPSEVFPIGFDFGGRMDSDIPEIINNPTDITITAVDNTDSDATSVIIEEITKQINPDNLTEAVVKIKAGTEAKSPYKITCKIVTSESNTLEGDALLYVKDN